MSKQVIDYSARENSTGVNDLFIQRWSPRAFEKVAINEPTMTRIIEAARWSPSSFNVQPWRFYTSTENTFDDFLSFAIDSNQEWAKDCAVIGFLVAEKNFDRNGKPNGFSKFDSGAAWMAMTLQARLEGYYTHAMGGIDAAAASEYLKLDSAQSELLMGFTIGKLADLSELDDEQRKNETPNSRKELSEIWHSV